MSTSASNSHSKSKLYQTMSKLKRSTPSKGTLYMENLSFTLPNITDGVHALGELWDCNHSKSTGFNLFSRKPQAAHLIAHPIGRCDYSLVHLKNTSDILKKVKVDGTLKLELMGGLINVDASASYGNIDEKRSDEERLVCKYDSETWSVELLPFAAELIDPRVKEMIAGRRISATHIVKSIILGGEVSAELSIKESSKLKSESVDGTVMGKLAFGSVNSAVQGKLEFLDSEEAKNFEKSITVHSKPPIKTQPTTVTEMFAMIDNFESAIEKRQHFKEIGEEIGGVPIRFVLVPIEQFLDVKISRLYIQLKEDILNEFTGMLGLLRDYKTAGYVAKSVVQLHPRLKFILEDEDTPMMVGLVEKLRDTGSITGLPDLVRDSQLSLLEPVEEPKTPLEQTKKQGILAYEKELRAFANESFSIAFKALNDFKIGKAKVEHLQSLVEKFNDSSFSEAMVDEKIKLFISWGKEELFGIHDTDAVSMKADVLRLTNKRALNEWWATEEKIKLLIQTKLPPGGRCPNGVFRRVFQISGQLKAVGIEVGLALPSISRTFDLNVKINGEVMVHQPSDIAYVFGIVCTTVGIPCIESYFHTVNASIFKTSLPLPHGPYDDINSLVVNLSMNRAVYITRSPQHTHQKLTSYIEDLERGGKEWKFFICLDAIDTTLESIEKLKDFMPAFSGLPIKSEWNAGSLGFTGAEFTASPLMFLFRKGVIEAICFDNLDLLILKRQFEKMINAGESRPDLSVLSPENSLHKALYPDRATFALEVVKLVHQIRNHKLDDVPLGMGTFIEPPNRQLLDVLELARDAVSKCNLSVLSTVASDVLEEFRELEGDFKRNGWSVATRKFTSDKPEAWQGLYTLLDNWLSTRNPLLSKVAAAKGVIKQAQALQKKAEQTENKGNSDSESSEPENLAETKLQLDLPPIDVDGSIHDILIDPSCPKELNEELERWRLSSPTYRYIRMLDVLEKFILSPEYKEQFHHVLALVSLLKQLVDSQATKEGKEKPIILDVYEILPSYVEKLDPNGTSLKPQETASLSPLDAATFKKLNDFLRNRRFNQLVTLLAKCSYGPYLAPLHSKLDQLTDLSKSTEIVNLIKCLLIDSKELYSEEQKRELWSNSKFQYLVNCTVGSDLQTIKSFFNESKEGSK